ncbi:MAG: hypothetical protein ACFE9I_01220 [Candidatus Hermodarchaeota archaeon]
MKIRKNIIIIGLIIGFFCYSVIFQKDSYLSYTLNTETPVQAEYPDVPLLSTSNNKDHINDIINSKISQYYSQGYFSQLYKPSIQAAYHVLFILHALDKLDGINQSWFVEYIISHYDPESYIFMDELAYRYLNADFSQKYYPLSTVLEINCYAVLSLEILNALDEIDIPEMISFIWSCYNDVSSGFIGQPYDSALEEEFKVATADNTYFAVKTLDLLMDDWVGYATERHDIIQFINDLQLPGGSGWNAGGFVNDLNTRFDSLYPYFDPSLLASYYCLKALQVFGMVGTIRTSDFHQFLNYLYNDDYFRMSELDYNVNYSNIVATSIGLDLSNITGFTSIDNMALFNFLLSNRNALGNWDGSTTIPHHELIDTFQILRSLYDYQELSQLTLEEKDEIGNSTMYYWYYNGYSSVSEDYTSMNLLHTIVLVFDLYDRMSELNIPSLYTQVKDSYFYTQTQPIANFFSGYLEKSREFLLLRSYPVEYFSYFVDRIARLSSHKSTFLALDILRTLFKLDDFASQFDLQKLMNDIIATQFLNDSYYESYGGFTFLPYFQESQSEYLSNKIFLENSYYAIKCLELLEKYLDLGELTTLGFDKNALFGFIDRNIIETPTTLYFNPKYTNDLEITLRNTYYMIYLLKTLDMYIKNTNKIKNFVLANLNYNNIENVYYCYKISEILGLDIEFNTLKVQNLVHTLYDNELKEFYETTDRTTINQEAFLWICEMARNSEIKINAIYDHEAYIGGSNKMSASLQNLILRDFGTYITFKFECDQLGTFAFIKGANNTYSQEILIPLLPENYPVISGKLCAYEGSILKAEYPLSFTTTYELEKKVSIELEEYIIHMQINSSLISGNVSRHELTYGSAYIQVFIENIFDSLEYFSHNKSTKFSMFTLDYYPLVEGNYRIEIFLDDGFQVASIENMTFYQGIILVKKNLDIAPAIPLTVTFILVPGVALVITNRQLEKIKKEKLNHSH